MIPFFKNSFLLPILKININTYVGMKSCDITTITASDDIKDISILVVMILMCGIRVLTEIALRDYV